MCQCYSCQCVLYILSELFSGYQNTFGSVLKKIKKNEMVLIKYEVSEHTQTP